MLLTIKKYFLKNWKNILLLFLIIFCIFQCDSNYNLNEKNLKFEIEKSKHLENIKKYNNSKKLLENKVLNFEDSIKKLEKEKKFFLKEIETLKKDVNKKIEKVKTFSSNEIKDYFQDRYNILDIPLEPKGLVFKDTLSRLVITDLIKGDCLTAELKITKKIINNQNLEKQQKDSIIENKDKQIFYYKLIDKQKDSINDNNEKIIKDTKKQLKRQKTKTTISTLITTASLITSTILILNK